MQLGETDLKAEDFGKVILTFDVSDKSEEIKEDINLENMHQNEFDFGDGLEENQKKNNRKEINTSKDEAINSIKCLNELEADEAKISRNFKEYIKICNEMDLIPSWISFEKYTHIK